MASFFVSQCKQVVFYANDCNFVTIVGLTNDERCFIHNLHVEQWRRFLLNSGGRYGERDMGAESQQGPGAEPLVRKLKEN